MQLRAAPAHPARPAPRACSYSGTAPAAPGGFAFGAKYIGQVASVLPGAGSGASGSGAGAGEGAALRAAIIPADLDGELSQQLQKLSKRDATTKLKALQVLRVGRPVAGAAWCGGRCWERVCAPAAEGALGGIVWGQAGQIDAAARLDAQPSCAQPMHPNPPGPALLLFCH